MIEIRIKRPRRPRVWRPYLSQGQGGCGHCEGCMAAFQEQVDNERPGHWWRVEDGKLFYKEDEAAEKMLGRKLKPTESVIVKNGDFEDCRPENLEVVEMPDLGT